MIYGKIEGAYKKVNGIYRNVSGIVKETNKRYEIVKGVVKKTYHPWILVKNGKLVNKFHLLFANQYNQTVVDLKDYTDLYEDENGVWIELIKRYQYTGYMPRTTANTRFIICINVEGCDLNYTPDKYKIMTSYRSINYQCNYSDTLWGMVPFDGNGSREDYHAVTTAINGAWTSTIGGYATENCIVNGKSYLSLAGLQSVYAGTKTITYNSLKICFKDLYSFSGEI